MNRSVMNRCRYQPILRRSEEEKHQSIDHKALPESDRFEFERLGSCSPTRMGTPVAITSAKVGHMSSDSSVVLLFVFLQKVCIGFG